MEEDDIANDIGMYASSPLKIRVDTPKKFIEISESSDVSREEMKWNEKNSDLLRNWSKNCKEALLAHEVKAKKYKKLYAIFGLPSILIPISVGIMQPYLQENDLIVSLLMVLTGSLSGINTFFDFSRKRSKHLEANAKYSELHIQIQSILAIPKRNREAADVSITKILYQLNSINNMAPPL